MELDQAQEGEGRRPAGQLWSIGTFFLCVESERLFHRQVWSGSGTPVGCKNLLGLYQSLYATQFQLFAKSIQKMALVTVIYKILTLT